MDAETINFRREQFSSPMMQHFFDLKQKHLDSILLFRNGDFYECFFEDALAVGRVCNIPVGNVNEFPLVAFPCIASARYISKILKKGVFKVAVCDILNLPPSCTHESPIRKVVKVFTP